MPASPFRPFPAFVPGAVCAKPGWEAPSFSFLNEFLARGASRLTSSLLRPCSPWKTLGEGARNSHPAPAGPAVGIVDPRAGKMGAPLRDNKDPSPVRILKILQGSGLSHEPKGKEESEHWKTNKETFPEARGEEKGLGGMEGTWNSKGGAWGGIKAVQFPAQSFIHGKAWAGCCWDAGGEWI